MLLVIPSENIIYILLKKIALPKIYQEQFV